MDYRMCPACPLRNAAAIQDESCRGKVKTPSSVAWSSDGSWAMPTCCVNIENSPANCKGTGEHACNVLLPIRKTKGFGTSHSEAAEPNEYGESDVFPFPTAHDPTTMYLGKTVSVIKQCVVIQMQAVPKQHPPPKRLESSMHSACAHRQVSHEFT